MDNEGFILTPSKCGVSDMGSTKFADRRYAPNTGLEPHFHITHAEFEVSPDGTITIMVYEERRDELVLRFSCTVMAQNLIRMARAASTIAAEAHNVVEWVKMARDTDGH